MTLKDIDINAAIANAEKLLKDDRQITPSVRAVMSVLLLIIKLLVAKTGKNSRNSSIPPSQDPNRQKLKKTTDKRKPGGQPGRKGTTLTLVDDPDVIEDLKLDRRPLPPGRWKVVGHERRQVIDIQIQRRVTEYRAQVLENEHGQRHVADFPVGVTRPAQYGASVKAHAVYLSMFQLLPYDRIQKMFADQYGIPLSAGSLVNFNRDASARLDGSADDPQAWRRAAGIAQQLGDPVRAAAIWEAGWRKGLLEGREDLTQRIRLQLAAGTPARAAEMLSAGLANGSLPEDEENLRLLAESWHLARNREQALTAWQQLAEMTQQANDWMHLGQLATAWGEESIARDALALAEERGAEQAGEWRALLEAEGVPKRVPNALDDIPGASGQL